MHCILQLVVDQVSRKVVFELKNAPRFTGCDVPPASTNQSEIGDDGYPDGFLDAVDRFGDLMFAQTQATLELFEKNFENPYLMPL